MKTEVLKVERHNPDPETIAKAARRVDSGGLVAFPTETVYGLAAAYENSEALDSLYKVKRRERKKPFTFHIAAIDEVRNRSCEVSAEAGCLIDRFWPGPLTVILRNAEGAKLGFRMPNDSVALKFISMCKGSIVAPSANISGGHPPISAEDVLGDLDGKIDLVLDAGPSALGVESTVCDASLRPVRILRQGAVSRNDMEAACGGLYA